MKDRNWRVNRSPSMLPSARKVYYEKIKNEVFDLLGGECQSCGFLDRRALQVDHVGGGGNLERKKHSGTSFFLKVKSEIDSGEYQLLCANCNWIKRAVALEVPDKYPPGHVFPTETPNLVTKGIERHCSCGTLYIPEKRTHVVCESCVNTRRQDGRHASISP